MVKRLKFSTPDRILSILLKGFPVKIGEDEYVFDSNYELCVKRKRYKPGEDGNDEEQGEPVLLITNVTLKNFIDLCASMDESDYIEVCANITLSEINTEKWIRRDNKHKPTREEMYCLPESFYIEKEPV